MSTVTTPVSTPARHSPAGALLRATRPRQWPKNLLVFGAPAAAGVLFQTEIFLTAVVAFWAFTLAAAGTYLINDAMDAANDRLHPVKRYRPVAAGIIPVGRAKVLGGTAMALSLVPAIAIGRPRFVLALVTYIALTISYSVWLKQIAMVDVVAVALGFAVRAVAGGLAAGVPLSRWFVLVAFFGALFLVAGKRYGEHRQLGEAVGAHRPASAGSAAFYHQHVMTLSSGVTMVGYGLWAYQHGLPSQAWFLGSFLFLVMVLLRFSLLVHEGASDDPVAIVWNDRPLRILVVLWIALVLAGVELG
ncbi:MAG: decaprenyl-phosphate phosphoribosyltransferase [Actinomycetota bacterium]